MAGDATNIDIYLRIKPDDPKSGRRASERVVVDNSENKLEFVIPRNEAQGYVNNQREHYEFRFNGILSQDAKQDEVKHAPICMDLRRVHAWI